MNSNTNKKEPILRINVYETRNFKPFWKKTCEEKTLEKKVPSVNPGDFVTEFEEQGLIQLANEESKQHLQLKQRMVEIADEANVNLFVFVGHSNYCLDYMEKLRKEFESGSLSLSNGLPTCVFIIGCLGGKYIDKYLTNDSYTFMRDLNIHFFGFENLVHIYNGQIYNCEKGHFELPKKLDCTYLVSSKKNNNTKETILTNVQRCCKAKFGSFSKIFLLKLNERECYQISNAEIIERFKLVHSGKAFDKSFYIFKNSELSRKCMPTSPCEIPSKEIENNNAYSKEVDRLRFQHDDEWLRIVKILSQNELKGIEELKKVKDLSLFDYQYSDRTKFDFDSNTFLAFAIKNAMYELAYYLLTQEQYPIDLLRTETYKQAYEEEDYLKKGFDIEYPINYVSLILKKYSEGESRQYPTKNNLSKLLNNSMNFNLEPANVLKQWKENTHTKKLLQDWQLYNLFDLLYKKNPKVFFQMEYKTQDGNYITPLLYSLIHNSEVCIVFFTAFFREVLQKKNFNWKTQLSPVNTELSINSFDENPFNQIRIVYYLCMNGDPNLCTDKFRKQVSDFLWTTKDLSESKLYITLCYLLAFGYIQGYSSYSINEFKKNSFQMYDLLHNLKVNIAVLQHKYKETVEGKIYNKKLNDIESLLTLLPKERTYENNTVEKIKTKALIELIKYGNGILQQRKYNLNLPARPELEKYQSILESLVETPGIRSDKKLSQSLYVALRESKSSIVPEIIRLGNLKSFLSAFEGNSRFKNRIPKTRKNNEPIRGGKRTTRKHK